MTERVDVCIVGSGFGGSIAAWRLAELYAANDQDAARAHARARGAQGPHRLPPVDGHRPPLRLLRADPGSWSRVLRGRRGSPGRRRRPGRRRLQPLPCRFAARPERDLRTPRPPSGRRARPPDVAVARSPVGRSIRYYARAEAALRVNQPSWNQVAKSGGLWAATLNRAGNTCDRVPARDQPISLCRRQVVPHRLRLRRQELADHQLHRLRRAAGDGGSAADPGERDPPVVSAARSATWSRRRGSTR